MQSNNLFTSSPSVQSSRILYTPSSFARTSLLHLQEVGSLRAVKPHTSRRENLQSFLCFVVEDGEGTLEYEGRQYALKPSDAVFINCRKPYSHSTGGGTGGAGAQADIDTGGAGGAKLWSLRWAHFYGPSAPSIYAKYCERGGQPVIHMPSSGGLSDAHMPNGGGFSGILAALYDAAASDDHIRDMRINELLSSLLTRLMAQSWDPESGKHRSKQMNISAVRVYIDEHYAERLSLSGLAEQFFISRDYLGKRFKECFGTTVNGYILSARITRAKQLLRFSDKTIEEVGALTGMPDANYFSRTFKKVEGVSPGEYRRLW